jgi:type VI secretion system protein ImpH
MVPASGRNRPPLSQELTGEAFRFDFFQAVRLLERIAEEQAEADAAGRRYPVGQDYAPQQEIVFFRALESLAFPTGSISKIQTGGKVKNSSQQNVAQPPSAVPRNFEQPRAAVPHSGSTISPKAEFDARLEMVVNFLGLTGPNGVLPRHYTMLMIERVRQKDFALRDFLDMFNHRVVSLFYRAWEKYRFPLAYERAERNAADGREDLFTQCLYCLVGLGTGGLRGRMHFDDEAFLYYAGHFAHFPRSALSLEITLADYFALPVKVKQFQGQWLYLAREDQSSLPSARQARGRNCRLGLDVVVGQRVWDREGKFRVRLGPLDYAQFRGFTPAGDALGPFCQMIRAYAGPHFDFDVQPVLKAAAVPWCRLGGDGTDPARLGWNTWVRGREFDRDVSDAIFFLEG